MKYNMNRIPHSIVFADTLKSLYNNHKINFDGKRVGSGHTRHTSLDWFLSPVERPSIDKAEVKEHYVDIPGMNGGLDLTESLTGFPLYNYIEGSFEFKVLNDRKLPELNDEGDLVTERDLPWEILNRDIRTFLNGKKKYMMLEDDPSWYYVGRFTVEKYDSSETANSKITISYKVYPFKRLSVHPDRLQSFFDTQPFRLDDTNQLLTSFWNKKSIELELGETVGFRRAQIPCGEEATQIIFRVVKPSKDFNLFANLKTLDRSGVIIREVASPVISEPDPDMEIVTDVKVHGFVITNLYNSQGACYSDNILEVSVSYPDTFSELIDYVTGDLISYFPEENNREYLRANEDIPKGNSFDISKWTVDEDIKNQHAIVDIVYDIGVM